MVKIQLKKSVDKYNSGLYNNPACICVYFLCSFLRITGVYSLDKEETRVVIDVHSHILPGVDDGSKNPEVSRKMLEIAAEEGIEAIIATPHFEGGMTEKFLSRREKAFELTSAMAAEMDPPIKMYLGNEIFYGESAIEALENGTANTLNGTDYALVEFPVYSEFSYIEKAIKNLIYAGYIPVIAHIERYEGMKKKYQVEELKKHGAVMQVNASTVTGGMGWGIKRYVLKLMKAGLVDLLGTDAHGVNRRRPEIREALSVIDKKVGREYRILISEENPEKILRGENISGKVGI